jgi:Na+/proline symporter
VIFCAAMSSTSSELTALGSASMLDLYKRARHGRRAGPPPSEKSDLVVSKLFTVLWGAVAIAFATFASLIDNLIQAVNILGSIFYGTVLGLFVVGFFVKRVGAGPVLLGALVAQATVTTLFFTTELGFLWYTVVGCGLVVAVGLGAEQVRRAGR